MTLYSSSFKSHNFKWSRTKICLVTPFNYPLLLQIFLKRVFLSHISSLSLKTVLLAFLVNKWLCSSHQKSQQAFMGGEFNFPSVKCHCTLLIDMFPEQLWFSQCCDYLQMEKKYMCYLLCIWMVYTHTDTHIHTYTALGVGLTISHMCPVA